MFQYYLKPLFFIFFIFSFFPKKNERRKTFYFIFCKFIAKLSIPKLLCWNYLCVCMKARTKTHTHTLLSYFLRFLYIYVYIYIFIFIFLLTLLVPSNKERHCLLYLLLSLFFLLLLC